jgi:hypothetical protein
MILSQLTPSLRAHAVYMDEAMEEFIFLFAWEPILLPAFAG